MPGKKFSTACAGAVAALALAFSTAAGAQTLSELDRLIFEPVPLDSIDEDPDRELATDPTALLELAGEAPEPGQPGLQAAGAPGAGSLLPDAPPSVNPSAVPLSAVPLSAGSSAVASLGPHALADNAAPVITDSAVPIEVYEGVIEEMMIEDGPYTPEMTQELLALGELYQQEGEHEEALKVFERAAQLARVNTGLYSLEQLPSIDNMIESLVALERTREAEEKHEYRLYLHNQHYGPDDPRIIPALLKLAEWHMNAFQEDVRFEAEGMLIADDSGAGTEKGVRRMAFQKLFSAQEAYLRSISILLENGDYRDPRLIDLEQRLIEIYFLHAHRAGLVEDPENYLNVTRYSTGSLIRHRLNGRDSPAYQFGKEAYSRILAYQMNDPNSSQVDYARTLMELGDWYLLFGRRSVGQDKYREAYEMLASAGYPADQLDELMRPEVPTTLPVFTPTPHTRDMLQVDAADPLRYRGYVDLSFEINEYGKAGDIRTLDKSPQTSLAVERRLTRLVRQSQFRPRFLDGKMDSDEVSLRYYYTY